jgi:hypothetical protein
MVQLKEYDSSKDMPSKFIEGSKSELQSITGNITTPPVTSPLPVNSSPNNVPELPGQREYINLQDILASHSSSRDNLKKLNKRK